MIERQKQKRVQQSHFRPARTRAALAACGVASAVLFVGACGSNGSATTGSGEGEAAASASPAAVSTSASASTSAGASASPSASRLTDDQAERQRLVPAVKVGYEKAGTTAQQKVSGGKLVALELERAREGGPRWQTDIAQTDGTVQRVDVEAIGGEASAPRADSDQDTEDKQKLADRLKKAKVTWDKAAKTATDRKKGTVTTVELDEMDDTDRLVWKVDVVTPGNWDKTTYDIDAADGSVVREHVDRD